MAFQTRFTSKNGKLSLVTSPKDLEYAPPASTRSSSPASASSETATLIWSSEKTTRSHTPRPTLFMRILATRHLTLKLICGLALATVLLCAGTLISLTHHRSLVISLHTNNPATWQNFVFLEKYYNGLLDIVPITENKPEYPPSAHNFIPPSASTSSALDAEPTTNATSTRIARPTPTPVAYNPYPDYSGKKYQSTWQGEYRQCNLPNNITLVGSSGVQVYNGIPSGMAEPFFGSFDVVGLDSNICYERRTRMGPYGYKDVNETAEASEVEWTTLDWNILQKDCMEQNAARFSKDVSGQSTKKPVSRTAILLRVFEDYTWQPLDYIHLRSLITETSLLTGGEYTIHILLHVKNTTLSITEPSVRSSIIASHISPEFAGLVTLWNEPTMKTWYPGLIGDFRNLTIHGAYRSMWMPLQKFMVEHEEYDYAWQWEIDVRYPGHWYHFFDKLADFARRQPRKGLWERNGRYYVPSVHGSWEEFTTMVANQEHWNETVWGAVHIEGINSTGAPVPLFETPEEDVDSNWGLGEEADLITLGPIFDPKNTTWGLRDDFTGYGQERPEELDVNPFWDGPPRRAVIVTPSRLSRKLVMTMHAENAVHNRHMSTELWPSTVALHYGMKAVYAPHPVYMDRKWPARYLESMLNNGLHGASGGGPKSIFGKKEHNFLGASWYYNAGWPGVLWRRWLGWAWDGNDGQEWEEEHGRMCLPAFLLHPIKDLEA